MKRLYLAPLSIVLIKIQIKKNVLQNLKRSVYGFVRVSFRESEKNGSVRCRIRWSLGLVRFGLKEMDLM